MSEIKSLDDAFHNLVVMAHPHVLKERDGMVDGIPSLEKDM